jgi:hypothetical protein
MLIFATLTVLALLYFFGDARKAAFFPRCPFHYFTGLFCPGCGSQRAISAMLHSDFSQAARYNLLLVSSIPILFYSAGVTLLNATRGKQLSRSLIYSPQFVKVYLVIVIVFFIARNIPYYPFDLLAPHAL